MNTKKWSDSDLCEFAEWIGKHHNGTKWKLAFILNGGHWFKKDAIKGFMTEKSTSQLIKEWEIETGRRKT